MSCQLRIGLTIDNYCDHILSDDSCFMNKETCWQDMDVFLGIYATREWCTYMRWYVDQPNMDIGQLDLCFSVENSILVRIPYVTHLQLMLLQTRYRRSNWRNVFVPTQFHPHFRKCNRKHFADSRNDNASQFSTIRKRIVHPWRDLVSCNISLWIDWNWSEKWYLDASSV